MEILMLILCFIVAYLIGSINTSMIVSNIYKKDIREHGSGNAGATNALRTFGKLPAAIVLFCDFLKAVVAILISYIFIHYGYGKIFEYAAGTGVILGHNYPVYFGFRGGKGVITSFGVILMIHPIFALVSLVSAALVMMITKYVSLGSIFSAIMFFILSFFTKEKDTYFIIFAFITAVLLILRHKENIKRLIKGEESKLGKKKTDM